MSRVAYQDTKTVTLDTDSPDRHVEVSIVIPCLNEERTVGSCVQKALKCIESMGITGEVVVSDNGSEDSSVDRAVEAGARVVHCEVRGYGAAIQYGVRHSSSDIIVMGDADDSYDFESIEPFVEELQSRRADMVMGNRFLGGIKPGAMPWKNRYIGNPFLSRLLVVLFGGAVRDAHCGLRSFTRDAYMRISPSSPGMEFASELVIKALLHGLSIKEVPTTLSPDGRDRPPHLAPWRDGWRHLMLMVSLAPFHACFLPAVLCTALASAITIDEGGLPLLVVLYLAAGNLLLVQLYFLGRLYVDRYILGQRHARKVLRPTNIGSFFCGLGICGASLGATLFAGGVIGAVPALILVVTSAESFSFGSIVALLANDVASLGTPTRRESKSVQT